MNWLYSKWWKWLCAALLVYILVGGFIVPLAPGISQVEPTVFRADSVYTFHIKGYNSHFSSPQAGKMQLWFKSGSNYYCPLSFKTINDEQIDATFSLSSLQQDTIKDINFDIVANNDLDGTFALREGVTFIKSKTVDSLPQFSVSPCEVEVKHNKHQFISFPYREILYESVRATFYHVPMWFVMTALVLFSLVSSIRYLMSGDMKMDIYAHKAIVVALLFGISGYLTGTIWSKYTWFIGSSWSEVFRGLLMTDVKLAGALLGIAVYLAYLLLRSSIDDELKRARIAAVYNIFALVIFSLFIFIIPRLTDSLHPGNGGNPAFSKYDLDSTLRLFFYPAVIAWILLGFWILSILIRMELIRQKQES